MEPVSESIVLRVQAFSHPKLDSSIFDPTARSWILQEETAIYFRCMMETRTPSLLHVSMARVSLASSKYQNSENYLQPFDALRVPVVDQTGWTADDNALGHWDTAQGLVPALQHCPHQRDALQSKPGSHARLQRKAIDF